MWHLKSVLWYKIIPILRGKNLKIYNNLKTCLSVKLLCVCVSLSLDFFLYQLSWFYSAIAFLTNACKIGSSRKTILGVIEESGFMHLLLILFLILLKFIIFYSSLWWRKSIFQGSCWSKSSKYICPMS